MKEKGLDNNLLELIAADPAFNLKLEDLKKTMDPTLYTGRGEGTGGRVPGRGDPAYIRRKSGSSGGKSRNPGLTYLERNAKIRFKQEIQGG